MNIQGRCTKATIQFRCEQQLFYRKYYYLQSNVQIAGELGISERSAEGKIYRMRKKLQKIIGGNMNE